MTQQTFLLSLFVRIFQQCHLSQIDEVLKFDDSTIIPILHRMYQISMNCQCKWLLVSTSVNSCPSPEKFLFCTDKLESIGWQDLAPRQRTGDCSVIHQDFVICRYRVTKLFCSRYCFASASSAESPCNFGSQTGIAFSVFWEVSINTVLRPERCVCGCRHFCVFEIICELPQPFRKISQTVIRISIVIPLYICFFWERRRGFVSHQLPGAASSLRSEPGLGDVLEDVAMWKTNWHLNCNDNPGTTGARNCVFCKQCSSPVWSTVV